LQVKELRRQTPGYSKCLELLLLELILLHTFNKSLALVEKEMKNKKTMEVVTNKHRPKLKLKPKLRKMPYNKLKPRKPKRKEDTKRRREDNSRRSKKSSKDSNRLLKNKRDKCSSNSKWNKKK
jgi:hypothetical protein